MTTVTMLSFGPQGLLIENIEVPDMPKFDPTKPVQTRDGQPARIICDDVDHPTHPIVGVTGRPAQVYSYTIEGMFCDDGTESPHDLVNIGQSRWINVFGFDAYVVPGEVTEVHESRASADFHAGHNRIAILEIPENGTPVLHDLRAAVPGVAVQIDGGWIDVHGHRPSELKDADFVQVRFYNGTKSHRSRAMDWAWGWDQVDHPSAGMEIVAYRKVP